MNQWILAVAIPALGIFTNSALAHDGCERDRVTEVDNYGDESVVHYDHHHSYYDEDGNVVTVHHDHHSVVDNDNDYRSRRRHHSGFARLIFGN